MSKIVVRDFSCIIFSKPNLTDDAEWMRPTNSGHRFFKVTADMP